MKSILAILGLGIATYAMPLVLLVIVRLFIQSRLIPPHMETMEPTLHPGDRLLIENISEYFQKPFKRGEIIVFYPPPIEFGGQDLSGDLLHALGRATGLPFLPYENAFVKRVIGLPGERIDIVPNTGVFVNGKLLEESSYVTEPPSYSLRTLSDIGNDRRDGRNIHPYSSAADATSAIVVPTGSVFVLGDNRNNSDDSHVFGMVDQRRVIGRAQLLFFPRLQVLEPPKYGAEH